MLKYLVVAFAFSLCAFIVCVHANDDDVHAELKSSYSHFDGFGHYKYGFDVANGVEAKAEGDVNGVHGEYYLLNEKGEKIKVTYTADSTGFHPKIEEI